MKAIKYITLLFAITILTSSFAKANVDCGTNQTNCEASSTTKRVSTNIYQRKIITHNSNDSVYSAQRKAEAEARARQSSKRFSAGDSKSLTNSDKDGSILGGDCSNGKCGSKGRGTSIFGDPCTKAVKGTCFKACKAKCSSATKGSCTDSCAKSCSSCQKPTSKSCNGKRCEEGSCTPINTCPPDDDYLEKSNFVQNYVKNPSNEIYDSMHKCKDLAPIELKYVDFRIKKDRNFAGYSNKLGNYRFRIFGCRRFEKTAMLNQGRIMQKDLQFIKIFDDTMSDCYNITKTPDDLCLSGNNRPLPEYIITAEISDYFMNICDEYNWEDSKKEELRKGSSEMSVTWKVMDVTGSEVLSSFETTGYAELEDGEYNGEAVLVERAFADAINNLRNMPKFNEQLSKRISPKVLEEKRKELVEIEKITNPVKCGYIKKEKVAKIERKCGVKTVCHEVDTCTDEIISKVENVDNIQIEECSGLQSGGSYIVEDSGTSSTASISEKKEIITKEVIVGIDENSGYSSDGKEAPLVDEGAGFEADGRKAIGEIDENSGYSSDGKAIKEDGGYIAIGKNAIGEIDEASGYNSAGSGTLAGVSAIEPSLLPFIDEANGFNASGMFEDQVWVDIPVETVEQQGVVERSFVDAFHSLCIIDREPYDNLSPENLYKVRLSVVKIENSKGGIGSGLIVSDNFIMTSASLLNLENNSYNVETISGTKYKASAFRVSPSKNIALLVLDKETKYFPLSLNLDLPPVGRGSFMALGMLSFEKAEGKVDDKTTITSYRYYDKNRVDMITSSKVQKSALGSVLIDNKGTISGMSSMTPITNDTFMPISDALRSVGMRICDKPFPEYTPWYEKATTPKISTAIDSYVKPKEPVVMKAKDRK